MLLRFVVVIVNFYILNQGCWLLYVLMFLSLSILILIVQPYKKSYMNVLDGLLLALMGLLTLLNVTFQYLLPAAIETLPLILVIITGFPQLVLLLTLIYKQLIGKWIMYVTGKISSFLKKIHKQYNQAEEELSDTDSLPHRLVSPNQYNKSLLSESEQTHKTLTVQGQVPPVYTYGSIS